MSNITNDRELAAAVRANASAQLNKHAQALGRIGGKVKSEAKARAARKNGKLGGWPKGRAREKKRELEGKLLT